MPKKPSLKKVSVRIPEKVHADIVRMAKRDGLLVERIYLDALLMLLEASA